MEDEGFVDDDFIAETAWEYIGQHGEASVAMLRSLAETTSRAGDEVSSQTWRAIAEAAARILSIV
jgi:hypothetical protein